MHSAVGEAESTLVGDSERGQRIQKRIERLGISDREFHEKTGIDRKTLRRAVDGEERVRASTYSAIEAALDKMEAYVSGSGPTESTSASQSPEDDLVEFNIEGNFGVRVVVRGPVRDVEALEASVAKLIRDMQSGRPNTP